MSMLINREPRSRMWKKWNAVYCFAKESAVLDHFGYDENRLPYVNQNFKEHCLIHLHDNVLSIQP